MSQDRQHIDQLLSQYLEKRTTESEVVELLQWVNESDENKRYFTEQVDAFRSLQSFGVQSDVEQNWTKIQQQTLQPKGRSRSLMYIVSSVVAACLLFFFLPPFFTTNTSSEIPIAIVEHVSGDSIQDVKLADGSMISLNETSKLTTPTEFVDSARNVSMEGNCYFEVAHNPEKPFRVKVNYVTVEVLGTKFTIEEDTVKKFIEVSLLEGKVRCTDNRTGDTVILVDKMRYKFFDSIQVLSNTLTLEHQNPLAWKTGVLEFHNTPLSVAVEQIEKFYDKEITFSDDNMQNCPLNAKLHKYKFEDVLTMFELAFDFSIQNDGKNVLLTGQGCSPDLNN